MGAITVRNDFDVELVDCFGSDLMICKAARVSTLGAASIDSEESEGLIKFLMRHRIGFSYNEQSGRYMELSPVFYVPPPERLTKQVGRPGQYMFEAGDSQTHMMILEQLVRSYQVSWESYQRMLEADVAKEIARMCLPVAIFSSAYVTCNPRSLMSFLSLRVDSDISTFPSKPQWEINQVANKMEEIFAELWPLTYAAFLLNGRVAP